MFSKIFQIPGLIIIAVLAASCATSNQYISKLFAPRSVSGKDSIQLAVKFLELDRINGNEDDWVKTDIIGKDTTVWTSNPLEDEPVIKTGNPDTQLPIVRGTRTKKTRD